MPVRAVVACTVVLIVLLAVAAVAGVVVVPFTSVEAIVQADSNGLTHLSIPDFSAYASPGDPALPYVVKHILVPSNVDPSRVTIEIRNAIQEELPDEYDIAPVPPIVTRIDGQTIEDWKGKAIQNGRNMAVYGADRFFPINFVMMDGAGELGPYRLISVVFWPYRYNPVSGQLIHLVSGDVALNYDDVASIPGITNKAAAPAFLAGRLSQIAENPWDASQWYAAPAPAPLAAGIPLTIITTDYIVANSTKFANFVAHKTNMGFTVTVATETDWGGGVGDAASEAIRAWLQENYATKAEYCILIGNPHPDSGNVPMKMLWPRNGTGAYEDGPSDYYYADLTGNWDLDGDGRYGEAPNEHGQQDFGPGGVDRIPEVIIGRIPYYGSITDLDKILQKTINYETNPSIGNWAQRMLTPLEPLDPNTPLWHLGEALRTDVAKPGQLVHFRIYEEDYGIIPPPEMTPCNENNVLNEWKKGYGFVFWGTHGWTQGASDIFSTPKCPLLDDTKPAFVFQGSCENGHPEDPNNLGYSLLRNGAIGTISASRVSWYYPGQTSFANTDSDPGMTYKYAKCIAIDRLSSGDAWWTTNVTLPNNIWANHVVFNLYGDPTVKPAWPTTMSIETNSVAVAKVGQAYLWDLKAAGGRLPYRWSLADGSLPDGLTVRQDGAITGTPRSSGQYEFTLQCQDADFTTSTKSLSMEVKLSIQLEKLDTNPNWTCEGLWEYGIPTGGGSYNQDPTSGHTGNNVYGYNLNGNYPNSMKSTEYLTSTAFDCSIMDETTLVFWRWLGVHKPSNDRATVEVSTNGTVWNTVWVNPDIVSDSKWVRQSIDISSLADGQPTVYVRWGMGPTNASIAYPGWNIDDIELEGIQTKPLIRHTPLRDTDITTLPFMVSAEIVSPAGGLSGKPVLSWKTTGGYNQVEMSKASGNTYICYIPAQPAGTTVSYYIVANSTGGHATAPAGAPAAYYQFDVIVDSIPPTVVYEPLPNTQARGPYQIYATITDNLGINSAVLYWSKNGGLQSTVIMTRTNNPNNPNEFTGSIPGPGNAGDWFNYRVVATDSSQQQHQTQNPVWGTRMFSILSGSSRVYFFPFDSDPGWLREGMWAFGRPSGGGGANGYDPSYGTDGPYIFGYNLNGYYPDELSTTHYLTTEPLDCANISGAQLAFYRWLGVEGNGYDEASIQISSNGVVWNDIWTNPATPIIDTVWQRYTYDISQYADGSPMVFIRWGIGPTSSSSSYAGWNIDNVEIWGRYYAPVETISDMKTSADGSTVFKQGCVVSACLSDGSFYIQEQGTLHGIRVAWPGSVEEGKLVTVKGVIRTRNGEREIVAESVILDDDADAVKPVAMGLRALGGVGYGTPPTGQSGVDVPRGPNNIGTLVKVAGRITQTSANYFYIDDGSGLKDGTSTDSVPNVGVRIEWPSAGFTSGQFVTVTGVSSCFKVNQTKLGRRVLPRRGTDFGQ